MPAPAPHRPATAAAFFRILVAVVVLGAAEVWRSPLLVPAVVCPPGVVQALRALVLLAAALTLIGLATRASSAILAASLAVLLGLVQRQGTPLHVHHLVWLSVLVALGSSGAAWSVDAWRRDLRPDRDKVGTAVDTEAAWTPRFACLVLGLVYFFPGVHKIVDPGTPFLDAASLVRLVRLKSLEASSSVPFQLDAQPTLVLAGAWIVIALEVVAPFVAVWRPRLAFIVVVILHASFTVVLHMPYTVLSVFALVFLIPPPRPPSPALLPRGRIARTVCVVLLAGIAQAGVRGDMAGYPFACYPTFAVPVPQTIDLVIVEVERDGRWQELRGDLVVPDDLRSAATYAARQLRTPDDAQRFLDERRRDARFAGALDGATRVRVVQATRDLGQEALPELNRRSLLTAPSRELRALPEVPSRKPQ